LKLGHSTADLFGFGMDSCGMFGMLGMVWISGELTDVDDGSTRPFSGEGDSNLLSRTACNAGGCGGVSDKVRENCTPG
jgi:hypothetical protein